MRAIHMDGVEIEVTRKAIRSLRLRVCPPLGRVRLSVPWHAARADVLRFVLSRREWIRRHRERILEEAVPAVPASLADGDTVCLWGQSHVVRLETGRPGLERVGDILCLRSAAPSDPVRCARALDRECRKLLLERLRALTAVWIPALGVPEPVLRIRSMKTRWGSCNPRRGRIWINADLVRREPECLEYVLVHELAHLLEHGHTERFRATLDRHLPDWRQRRNLLNGRAPRPDMPEPSPQPAQS